MSFSPRPRAAASAGAASFLGVAREELTRTTCQIKSFLADRASLTSKAEAMLSAGIGKEGKGLRALALMVEGAMGGAIIGFSPGIAQALAAIMGVAAAKPLFVVALVVFGLILLHTAITELPAALKALRDEPLFDE